MSTNEAKKIILNAVIELISKKPLNKLSIREIAKKAGMNSAAISYYFGSKEILFNETMKYYWGNLCRIYERIMAEKQLTSNIIHAYCKEIMYFYFKSSGILRSEQSNFIEQGMNEDTKQRIELQLNAIGQIILSIKPQTRKEELMVKTIRFICSLAHPALFIESSASIMPKEMVFDDFLNSYITDIIENI
jgi:AcrR family transcriptional regulator